MTIKNYKISIITVVKNSEKTIEKTIKSIIDQTYKNYQYIVIDGGSTDNTLEILQNYKTKIDILVSNKDDGIWDAMNKSLQYVTGDIVGFLNSDDFYYNNALECVNKYFNNHNINFLFGSVEKYKLMHGFKPSIIDWSFGFYTSHSVGFFIKADDHKKIGYYNKNYLSSDLDFFYKMIKQFKMKGMSTSKEEIFGKFGSGGFSSKINYIDHLIDLNKIRIDNNQNILFVYSLFFIKILKKPFKFLKALFSKK
jgi:glycosyltransferase involved in cell wall biosynthesis